MKSTVLFAILVLLAGLGWAQQPASTAAAPAQGAPAQAAKSPVPDGTLVAVEAKQDVPTQKAKVGDTVRIEAVEDGKDENGKTVRGPGGKPVIPRKTKFTGRVTSVAASSKESKNAKLSLVVTSATLPDGKTIPFLGVVLGPFKVSKLSSGIGMQGDRPGSDARPMPDMGAPEVPSGIDGVDIKIDSQLGTVLVAPMNFALENGTQFHLRYVDPAVHSTQAQQPPAK